MITCKSPVPIMKAAFELGPRLFADHPHQFGSPAFTPPQRFACLALREHQNKSYRGVEALPADCSDLRAAVGLPIAPAHDTPCRAFNRLVPFGVARGESKSMNLALDAQAAQAKAVGLDVAGGEAKPSALLDTHVACRGNSLEPLADDTDDRLPTPLIF